MPQTDIGSSATGDNESTFQDYSVQSQTTDGAQDTKETEYLNDNWNQQLGYYKTIPELKSAIDAKARWTIGKGFKSNEITEMALSAIKGLGKDTFNSILENQERVAQIGGDSFAHIIRDDGQLINLKPLNPGVMKIIANRLGIITRYEQVDRHRKTIQKFQPEEIFHIINDRVADEIHGVGVVDAVETLILAYNEAIEDYKKVMHRNVYPVRKHTLDTDNVAEIATYKEKVAKSKYEGEDFFIPKGVVETEIEAVPSNATLDPKQWITQLKQAFWKAVGCPEIIVGGSQEFSEASAKIAYLAFEQVIEERQLYVEEQVLAQLNLEIELEFPATLQNEMLSDSSKSETTQASTPEDTSITNTSLQ